MRSEIPVRWRSRRRTPLALALLMPLTLSACSLPSGGGTAGAGTAIRASEDQPDAGTPAADRGWSAEFQLPDGRLSTRVAPLLEDEVPGTATSSGEAIRADDDQVLLAVSWSMADGDGVPAPARTAVLSTSVEDRLSLRDGDRRIPLEVDGLSRSEGFVYVAVSDPDRWGVEIEFDGVAQTRSRDQRTPVAEGPAKILYSSPAAEEEYSSCVADVQPPGFVADGALATCRARTASWPWTADLGWGEDGWTLVQVESGLSGTDGRDLTGAQVDVDVDGAAPRSTIGEATGPAATTYVFPAGGSLFSLRRTGVDAGTTVTLTGARPLRP